MMTEKEQEIWNQAHAVGFRDGCLASGKAANPVLSKLREVMMSFNLKIGLLCTNQATTKITMTKDVSELLNYIVDQSGELLDLVNGEKQTTGV